MVADQKSLSEGSLLENTHVIPGSTPTSRSSSPSSENGSGAANGPVEVITSTAHSVLEWITPLFNGYSNIVQTSSNHGVQPTPTQSAVGNTQSSADIEMSSLASTAAPLDESSSAYADVMLSSQSAIDMSARNETGNSGGVGAPNYCVVCLSKPASRIVVTFVAVPVVSLLLPKQHRTQDIVRVLYVGAQLQPFCS